MIEAAVVDASVGIKWVVPEAGSDLARWLSGSKLEAPDLFPVECANILWKKVRVGDLTARDAAERMGHLLQAPVTIISSRDLLADALEIACDLNHPVYDCIYLALARRRKIPLVTSDERLATVARKSPRRKGEVMLLSEFHSED